MRFDWDADKNEANIEKHGIDFADAEVVFDGFRIERRDDRKEYGEDRYQTIGVMEGIVVLVVFTPRNDTTRLISARRARRDEREAYEEARRHYG